MSLVHVVLFGAMPLIAIALGFWTAAVRPRDRLAWFLLFLGLCPTPAWYPTSRKPTMPLTCGLPVIHRATYNPEIAGWLSFP
jgi:hypothetical protein